MTPYGDVGASSTTAERLKITLAEVLSTRCMRPPRNKFFFQVPLLGAGSPVRH